MQKMRSQKGITLAIMIITVVVLIILVRITMDIGLNSVSETEDRKLQSELQMVGQATITEYSKAMQLGYISDDGSIPSNFVGIQLTDDASGNDDKDQTKRPILTGGAWALEMYEATGYKSYFRLTPEMLKKLDIENTKHTYIVNYYTGEVYNETKKQIVAKEYIEVDGEKREVEVPQLLYLKLNKTPNEDSKPSDTDSFVDVSIGDE